MSVPAHLSISVFSITRLMWFFFCTYSLLNLCHCYLFLHVVKLCSFYNRIQKLNSSLTFPGWKFVNLRQLLARILRSLLVSALCCCAVFRCICLMVHSSVFCSVSWVSFGLSYTLQVWMVTVFLHCWQRTEQHQENLQEQRCTTSARPALYPGPQHTSSQPSGASREVPGVY